MNPTGMQFSLNRGASRKQFPISRKPIPTSWLQSLALVLCGAFLFAGCSLPTQRDFLYQTHVTMLPRTTEMENPTEHPDLQKARQIADDFLLTRGFVRLTNPKHAWIEGPRNSPGSLATYEWKDGSKRWWAEQQLSSACFCVDFYLERGGPARAKTITQIRDALASEFETAFGTSRVAIANPR